MEMKKFLYQFYSVFEKIILFHNSEKRQHIFIDICSLCFEWKSSSKFTTYSQGKNKICSISCNWDYKVILSKSDITFWAWNIINKNLLKFYLKNPMLDQTDRMKTSEIFKWNISQACQKYIFQQILMDWMKIINRTLFIFSIFYFCLEVVDFILLLKPAVNVIMFELFFNYPIISLKMKC